MNDTFHDRVAVRAYYLWQNSRVRCSDGDFWYAAEVLQHAADAYEKRETERRAKEAARFVKRSEAAKRGAATRAARKRNVETARAEDTEAEVFGVLHAARQPRHAAH